MNDQGVCRTALPTPGLFKVQGEKYKKTRTNKKEEKKAL